MTNVDEASAAPAGAGGPKGSKSAKKTKKPMPLWQETILLLVLALLLAIIIKSLFVQAFYIPSPSMEPQFVKNDRILVQKVSYWGSASPSRGDIVVFKDPGGWLDETDASTPHSPVTKLMCGTEVMKSRGEAVSPARTSVDQNCRETWNCSLMPTALAGSTRPSGPAGL